MPTAPRDGRQTFDLAAIATLIQKGNLPEAERSPAELPENSSALREGE